MAAGTENYPANGVTFEQAQAYCAWLSRVTGQKYRLPTEEEGESLYDFRAAADSLVMGVGEINRAELRALTSAAQLA